MYSYIRQVLSLPFGVRLFLFSEAFLGIGMGIFGLLFNLHLLALQLNESHIGKITALGTILMGISSVTLSYFIDRWGRKRILLIGILLIGMGTSGVAFGTSLSHFYFSYSIYSFGMAMLVASEFPLLFMYCESKQQETISYSMVFAVFTLFVGLGTYLGGHLPSFFSEGTTVYQFTLLLTGAIIFLVFLFRFFLPTEQIKIGGSNRQVHGIQWAPSKNVWLFTGFSFLIGASFAILVPFFNIILKYRLDWSDEKVALLLTINGLCLFFSSFFSPYCLEKWGLRKTTIVIFLFSVIPSFVLAVAMPTSLFVVIFLFRSGIFTALSNLLEGQAMQATPDYERSLYSGMRSLGRNLASSVMSLVAGYILLQKNYTYPFLISGVILVLAFFYFYWLVLPKLENVAITDEPIHEEVSCSS